METKPPTITDTELALIKAFAQGYINALVEHDNVYEGFDEFYAYDDKWDVNIHMNGEPRTIHAVAHPQSLGEDGYLNTDTSNGWVEIEQQYNMKTAHRNVKVTPQ
jgi:hypothetical protein